LENSICFQQHRKTDKKLPSHKVPNVVEKMKMGLNLIALLINNLQAPHLSFTQS
jgi:hypothetical protein